MRRPLNPDEVAAWKQVMASVRPLRAVVEPKPPQPIRTVPAPAVSVAEKRPLPMPMAAGRREPDKVRPKPHAAATLDASWDRRLSRGLVQPDSTLDLHGHTLASAHALLDQGLDRALARGGRVLLLVTGKPPRAESERPHARGAIRSAIADWLAASRHADRIAAVRNAHPRHGGAGALYIVLRRRS